MDYAQYAQWADTAFTVGSIALCVGCPTAGLTYVVARMVVTQGAKIAAKRWALAGVAGVTATVAASIMIGGGGEGDGKGGAVPPGFTQSEMEQEAVMIVLQLGSNGEPEMLLQERVVNRQDIKKNLLPMLLQGQLKRIVCENRLPDEGFGDWSLLLTELRQECEQIKPSIEFVINKTALAEQ